MSHRDSKNLNNVATSQSLPTVNSPGGTLYVVATPIGNLDDISRRALKVLEEVTCILAEDTRHSKRLLTHFCINTRLRSCYEHNEESQVEWVKNELLAGHDLALISDAGTPLISDPGFLLVRALRKEDLSIVAVPGPSSIIAALSIAGLPTDRFSYHGFLSAKKSSREAQLKSLSQETSTLVLLESSHRIEACINSISLVMGADRTVVIARELTKRFETVLAGTASELCDVLAQDENQRKGEFVVMIKGNPESVDTEQLTIDTKALLSELVDELPLKKAAAIVSKVVGIRKNEAYTMALEVKNKRDNDR